MGGRTSTTWENAWNSGITKPIRVPVKLAKQVIRYARALDVGNVGMTEQLIDEFIELKRQQSQRLPQRFFTMDSPHWKVFNEFRRWLKFRSELD
ncbi:MAG: hypothetical protein HC907_35245 [Richelia sp. SM1_7_0]|nr:hypothetical protein [Richelia sp. SM1_7_0]NJR15727.1 hypothetical protein [Calothrix sp. CSU_2_0]